MKRIYVCAVIFVVIVGFTLVCENYVSATVDETVQLLEQAAQSRRDGDYPQSREYADSAWQKWRDFSRHSDYILVDLTIAADVTVSLARVGMLADTDDNERFLEECVATILMLEHFLADNRNVFDGMH